MDTMAARTSARWSSRRRGNLRLLVVLLAGIMLLWAWFGQQNPAPESPVPDTSAIRIGSWNLRKFSEGTRPNLSMISDLIRTGHLDVLAIEEVQQHGQAVQQLQLHLGWPWRCVISEPAGSYERFAVLHRSDRVELLSQGRLADCPEASSLARRPFLVSLRAGQFDFVLLVVHLWYGHEGANERRRQEMAALACCASRILDASAEKDLIVLGDFNEFRQTDYLRQFEEAGWRRLIWEPTNIKGTEVYDNLLIHPAHTREFTGVVGVLRFDETRYGNDDRRARDEVSDHRPVWAEFRIDLPDDD